MNENYMRPGAHTGGIRNLMLFYNGHYEGDAGVWKKDRFIPYICYVDRDLTPKEWFFDGGLFLAKWSFSSHGYEESEQPSDKRDWEWYLDKTFGGEGDLAELNLAVMEAGEQLDDREHQMKVVLMVPYPAPNQRNFGSMDGTELIFDHTVVTEQEATGNKKTALIWYVNELKRRWDRAGYSNLQLSGLYWMNEAVHPHVPFEEDVVRYAGELTHGLGLKYFWIPYFNAASYDRWRDFGFDAAALQPNHFFSDTDASRIAEAAGMAEKAGMGVEMEVDSRVLGTDGAFHHKYLNYLNGGIEHGYGGDVFRGYYQDVYLLSAAAKSKDPAQREVYDKMFWFVSGQFGKE